MLKVLKSGLDRPDGAPVLSQTESKRYDQKDKTGEITTMNLCKPRDIHSATFSRTKRDNRPGILFRTIRKISPFALIPAMALFLTSCGSVKLMGGMGRIDFDIDYPVGQITRDVTVTQDFISNASSITQIWLYGATYKRDNTATVDIRLYRDTISADISSDGKGDDSRLLASWTLDSAEMEDNKIIKLDVPASDINAELKGVHCIITISSPDGEPELSPTFWMTEEDVYPDGHLVINGYEQYNDLWFQVMGRK